MMYVAVAMNQPGRGQCREALRQTEGVHTAGIAFFTALYANFKGKNLNTPYAVVLDPMIPARPGEGPVASPDSGVRAVQAIRNRLPKAKIVVICGPKLAAQFEAAGADMIVGANDITGAVEWLIKNQPPAA